MNNKKIILLCLSTFIFLLLTILIFQGTKDISNDEESKETLSIEASNTISFSGDKYTKLYDEKNNKVTKLLVEEYIKGVVASEMPVSFEHEALKAQAVAARTFYYSHRKNKCNKSDEGEICNTTHCQVYKSKEECLSAWSEKDRNEKWQKIEDAVNETQNLVMVYDGELVMYPQFFSTSSGNTENAIDVFNNDIPYLKSVESNGEEVAPKFTSEITFTKNEFINILKRNYKDISIKSLSDDININKRADSGLVKEITVGNKNISGVEFRKIFSLNSANFNINIDDNNIKITCKGYGHGVGMSQWGANIMAKDGNNYMQILKHYYDGVEIKEIKLMN